jgi:hypothetical protein
MNAMLKVKNKPQANKSKALGYVLYEGPSALTGTPIVAILTLKTSNRKTGDMAQVWILDAGDLSPVELSKAKLDSSICGNCPHRQSLGGACYVNIGQAPLAVYRAYKAGRYATYDSKEHSAQLAYRMVRLGAYGDPSAVPFEVMYAITQAAKGHTGYVHQAAHAGFDTRFLSICMLSADTPKQAAKWQAMGAKTFRVALEGDSLAANEVECLADSEGIQCVDCGLCNGTQGNVAITVHGSRAKNFKSNLIQMTEVA